MFCPRYRFPGTLGGLVRFLDKVLLGLTFRILYNDSHRVTDFPSPAVLCR
jgi:hypothetical protein